MSKHKKIAELQVSQQNRCPINMNEGDDIAISNIPIWQQKSMEWIVSPKETAPFSEKTFV